jgi:hypothetical protein
VIYLNVLQCALRHAARKGIVRVLHQSNSTVLLDNLQTRRSIIQGAGQHYAYGLRSVGERR